MDAILLAAQMLFDPYVMLIVLVSAVFGLFVGAIPGLSATMATALLVPVTFFMDPVPALAAIVTVTSTAIFAGDIPGALLRIPGTPSSAAYTAEAHNMTLKGEAERALGVSLVCAVIGGLAGSLALTLTSPLLAEIAMNFSSMEYFWLACLGLTCAAFISSTSPVKGVASLAIGLFLATVGIDPMSGQLRYTFGSTELSGGIALIPAMIGMFAISELLRSTTTMDRPLQPPRQAIGAVFSGLGAILKRYRLNVLRGSGIGVLVGGLPGAGADMAAWISYGLSKRFSKDRDKFGTGHVEGLVDAGASNNAGLGAAWVPAIVFGIPGDSITAIVIGVLFIKGLNPGPTVFMNTPELIYAVFMTFFLANLLLLPLGWLAIKSSTRLLAVPREILVPIILIFCIVGSFAMNNSMAGVVTILVLGIVGYLMEQNGFPIAPSILGLVLGSMIEENFMRVMIRNDGNLLAFLERPIAGTLGVITLMIWLIPPAQLVMRRFRSGKSANL